MKQRIVLSLKVLILKTWIKDKNERAAPANSYVKRPKNRMETIKKVVIVNIETKKQYAATNSRKKTVCRDRIWLKHSLRIKVRNSITGSTLPGYQEQIVRKLNER